MTAVEVFQFPATSGAATAIPVDPTLIKGLESHLYVVEFGDHGIKVGVTAAPRNRLGQHRRDGSNFGRPVTRWWLSGPHVEALTNERQLIEHCRAKSGQSGTARGEYFAIPFAATLEVASKLPMTRGDRTDFDAAVGARADALKAFFLGVRS